MKTSPLWPQGWPMSDPPLCPLPLICRRFFTVITRPMCHPCFMILSQEPLRSTLMPIWDHWIMAKPSLPELAMILQLDSVFHRWMAYRNECFWPQTLYNLCPRTLYNLCPRTLLYLCPHPRLLLPRLLLPRLLRPCPTLPELVQHLVECFQITRKCIINRTPCQVVAERCEIVGPYRVEPKLSLHFY
jgi:hypothetical protein